MHHIAARLLLAVASAAFLLGATAPGQVPVDFRLTVNEMTSTGNGDYCSSVVIEPGVALTAKHCTVGIDGQMYVRQDGKLYPVAGVRHDPERDIATISVPGLQCPCADLAKVGPRALGETVVAVGYPLGGERTLTRGSYLAHAYVLDESGEELTGFYHITTVPIQPGNSGGALFVREGGRVLLIGIASWGLTQGGVLPEAPIIVSGFVPVGLP